MWGTGFQGSPRESGRLSSSKRSNSGDDRANDLIIRRGQNVEIELNLELEVGLNATYTSMDNITIQIGTKLLTMFLESRKVKRLGV